ncbi:TPA: hypothetical protein JBD66_11050 [Legionella pneumophila subsp. pneumophila]|nr:hypothetical protein [Legionella pneumophila subsp. pneumophila]HAU1859681.1 hypothetical protein [Legionella pneumophila]HAT9082678.1 hypothetical protein [Legionella pneumophila subsp. pneumophila]HAT9110239.1 hypothetical protein [Legionella pneumophila subsp. pneumophila]HAT9218516.1 hypothetical protein [Legionella pneumophila subsp. pneumophila]
MRIQTDTLKYAKILKENGFSKESSEGFFSTLTQIEIHNIYSIDEVDNMLSEAVRQVFVEQDKKLVEQRREFDERMKSYNEQLRENRGELLASRRWMIGTIITVGLSLAAYLSALIHFNH